MILLDTNVISEPLRERADPAVAEWLDRQDPETLYLSSITLAEIRYGISLLPDGRKRTTLHDEFEHSVFPHFASRIVDFDEAASRAYTTLRAGARSQGIAISDFDALIAASAASNGLAIATRDVTPFLVAGLHVINPFAA